MSEENKEDKIEELTPEEKELLDQALANFSSFIEQETTLDLWLEEELIANPEGCDPSQKPEKEL